MPRTKVNKSKAIREYLSENPESAPKDVVEALRKKRIRVSPQQVSMVKSKAGGRKNRKQKQSGHLVLDQLIAAKVLVQRCGSISEAKQAISALEKLI